MAEQDAEYEIATATIRAALVGYRMALGWQPTTDDIARKFCMTRQGAGDLMKRISAIVPIYQDDMHSNQYVRAKWRICHADNATLTAGVHNGEKED